MATTAQADTSKAPRSILYFTAVDISVPSGPGVNEREFVHSLRERYGKGVTFVLPEPASPSAELTGEQFIFFSTSQHRRSIFGYPASEFSAYRALREIARKKQFDLFVVRLRVLSLAVYFFARRANIPLAIHHLSNAVSEWESGGRSPWAYLEFMVSGFDRMITRRLARRAASIDTHSQEMFDGLIRRFNVNPKRLFLRDNVVNTERFGPMDRCDARHRLGLDRFKHIIGYTGNAPYDGGGAAMVRLAPRILAAYPHTGFVIVGAGDQLQPLQKEVQKHQLDAHFVLPGFRPYEEMPLYVNAFDVGLAFFRPGWTRTIGNSAQKIKQYVACGVPAIADAASGTAFLDEWGLGSSVDSGDEDRVLDAVIKWLSIGEAERVALREKGMEYVTKYSSPASSLDALTAFWARCLTPENEAAA